MSILYIYSKIFFWSEVINLYNCQRVRDLREDADLNQTEIAKLLYIDQRTYSNYEIGKYHFPIEHLIKLAQFHKTSVDYLVGMTDERDPYPRKRP